MTRLKSFILWDCSDPIEETSVFRCIYWRLMIIKPFHMSFWQKMKMIAVCIAHILFRNTGDALIGLLESTHHGDLSCRGDKYNCIHTFSHYGIWYCHSELECMHVNSIGRYFPDATLSNVHWIITSLFLVYMPCIMSHFLFMLPSWKCISRYTPVDR